MVFLAVKMFADVTETRNVIPSLEFKTCMIVKSYVKVCYTKYSLEHSERIWFFGTI